MRRFLLATLFLVVSATTNILSDPYLAQVVSDDAATKVGQSTTSIGTAGTEDVTFGANAGINLNSLFTYATGNNPAGSILGLSNGDMLVSVTTGAASEVTKIDCDGNKVSAFTNVEIAGQTDTKMLVGHDDKLFVAGGAGGTGSLAGFLFRYDLTTGAHESAFDITVDDADYDRLDLSGVIAQQSSGRILVSGKKDNLGSIIAYNPTDGSLDTSFGDTGLYQHDTGQAIWDMIIDNQDRIYFVYNDGASNTWVKRLHPDGRTEDATFDTSGNSVSGVGTNRNTLIALDAQENIVMATVSTSGTQIVLRKYDKDDGSSLGNGGIGSLDATVVLKSLIVDQDDNVILTYYHDKVTNEVAMRRFWFDAGFTPDSDFNGTGIQTADGGMTGNDIAWNDSFIAEDGRIYTVGGDGTDPFIMRLYGDQYVTQIDESVTAGTPGTLDTTLDLASVLDTTAAYDLEGLHAMFAGKVPLAIEPFTSGGHAIAFDMDGSTKIVRVDSDNTLNTTFNMGGAVPGVSADAPAGLVTMILDQDSNLLAVGQSGSSAWLQRYILEGEKDQIFNSDGLVEFSDSSFEPNAIRQQSHGRILVSGYDGTNTTGAIYAFKSTDGSVDTFFGSGGVITTGVNSHVAGMSVDTYNRILVVYQNAAGHLELARYLPHGNLDTTFGIAGKVTAITSIAGTTGNKIVIDSNGDIVVASLKSSSVSVRKYDNATGTAQYAAADLGLSNVDNLGDVVALADGKILVLGSRSGTNDMFVARVTTGGALDTDFNPMGSVPGVLDFSVTASGPTARSALAATVRVDGRISIVGAELNSGSWEPFLLRVYNEPYVLAMAQDISSPVGLIEDGLVGAVVDDQGFYSANVFYLEGGSDEDALNQTPRAIGKLDEDKYIVAVNGQSSAGDTESKIFMARFDLDGQLDTTFDSNGWNQLTHTYTNEYVRGMHLFEDGGVQKAILAGYVESGLPLNVTQSMLVQYSITAAALDSAFGGLHQDASGMAIGDAQEFHFVARQSTGRIIAAGLDLAGNGAVFAYKPDGSLDTSFGSYGKYAAESNGTGIYNCLIDEQDRVVMLYDDGSGNMEVARLLADGSGLDTTFGSSGKVANGDRIANVGASDKAKVALDHDGKIVVAAITDSNPGTSDDDELTVQRYHADGSTDGSAVVVDETQLSATLVSIAKVIIDNNNKMYVFMTDNDGDANGGDDFIVVRLASDMSGLDEDFNPYGVLPGRAMFRTLTEAPYNSVTRVLHDAYLDEDGRIVMISSATS